MIPSQLGFPLSPWCCVLLGEAAHTNIIVFGLIRPGLEPSIYHTRGEHTYDYTICIFSNYVVIIFIFI